MLTEKDIFNAKILMVDDEEISIRIMTDMLQKAGYKNIIFTMDSREAYDLYNSNRPDLLILDLLMPHIDGFRILAQLNNNLTEDYLPVMILTNDESQDTKLAALRSGAKDFLSKPFDRVEALTRIRNLIEVRLLHNSIQNQNRILDQKVKSRTFELYNTQLDISQRLARAVEYRDPETGMHVVRMSNYSACLAAKFGLPQEDCDLILATSPLHDIGKIGIPDSILRKPGKLTPEEWTIMKSHTTIGAELLSGSDTGFIRTARSIALSHHEKWDGSGYPFGLKGDEIPLEGRICCVCDVFDALTSKRPYKDAWTDDDALAEIKKCTDAHFDPKLVECFVEAMPQILNIKEKYPDIVKEERQP